MLKQQRFFLLFIFFFLNTIAMEQQLLSPASLRTLSEAGSIPLPESRPSSPDLPTSSTSTPRTLSVREEIDALLEESLREIDPLRVATTRNTAEIQVIADHIEHREAQNLARFSAGEHQMATHTNDILALRAATTQHAGRLDTVEEQTAQFSAVLVPLNQRMNQLERRADQAEQRQRLYRNFLIAGGGALLVAAAVLYNQHTIIEKHSYRIKDIPYFFWRYATKDNILYSELSVLAKSKWYPNSGKWHHLGFFQQSITEPK